MIQVWKNNQWRHLEGAKVYAGNAFHTVKRTDKLYYAGAWHQVGELLMTTRMKPPRRGQHGEISN